VKNRGFTLIETIYSCVLLSLMALFVLNLYPSSFLAIRRGESTLQAEMLAQTVLEDVKSRSFANLSQIQTNSYLNVTYGGITYTPTISISNSPDGTANASLLQVATVVVSWTYRNTVRNVTHTMYLANVTR
jgi:type II secretory pathway pseudopilin PulG